MLDSLRTIWYEPSATVRRLLTVRPFVPLHAMAAMAGIADILMLFLRRGQKVPPSPEVLWLCGLVLGPIWGIVSLYLTAGVLALVGQPLGGRAGVKDLCILVAYARLPRIATLSFWIPVLLLYGPGVYVLPVLRHPNNLESVLLYVLGSSVAVSLAWSLVILFAGLQVAQGFSRSRALLSLVIGSAVLAPLRLAMREAIVRLG